MDDEEPPDKVDDGRVIRVAVAVREFDLWLERFIRRLWSEAIEFEHPGWPQPWLKAVAAAFVVALILGIIPLIVGVFSSLLLGLGELTTSSGFAYVTLSPVRLFLANNSRGLPISPGALYAGWKTSGFLFAFAAALRSRAGRFAWLFFGLLTLPMVWLESPVTARWVACGITVIWWFLVSALVFGFVGSFSRDSNDDEDEPGRFEEKFARWRKPAASSEARVRAQAEERARRFGYHTLEDYFDERGAQVKKTISRELGIPQSKVMNLRASVLPPWVSTRVRLSPRKQREIVETFREGGQTASELALHFDAPVASVKNLLRRFQDYLASASTEGGDAESSEPRRG